MFNGIDKMAQIYQNFIVYKMATKITGWSYSTTNALPIYLYYWYDTQSYVDYTQKQLFQRQFLETAGIKKCVLYPNSTYQNPHITRGGFIKAKTKNVWKVKQLNEKEFDCKYNSTFAYPINKVFLNVVALCHGNNITPDSMGLQLEFKHSIWVRCFNYKDYQFIPLTSEQEPEEYEDTDVTNVGTNPNVTDEGSGG